VACAWVAVCYNYCIYPNFSVFYMFYVTILNNHHLLPSLESCAAAAIRNPWKISNFNFSFPIIILYQYDVLHIYDEINVDIHLYCNNISVSLASFIQLYISKPMRSHRLTILGFLSMSALSTTDPRTPYEFCSLYLSVLNNWISHIVFQCHESRSVYYY